MPLFYSKMAVDSFWLFPGLVANLSAISKARDVRLLHPAKRPDFVALNALAFEVPHRSLASVAQPRP
jgi:hypothetical protein